MSGRLMLCGTCGAPSTSYYIAGGLQLAGCDLHPVLPHPSAAIPWGSTFGFTPIGWQGPAMHTYTPHCAGFHAPGPCP